MDFKYSYDEIFKKYSHMTAAPQLPSMFCLGQPKNFSIQIILLPFREKQIKLSTENFMSLI